MSYSQLLRYDRGFLVPSHRLTVEQMEAGRAVAIRKRKESSEKIRERVIALALTGRYETQGEIARVLKVSRATVNRVLREARDDQ